MAKHSDDSEVGYGKPPLASRFQKGKSGNPGGRPRGDRTLAAELEKALDQTVTGLKKNGKRQRKSVRGIVAANLAKKAAEGNIGAVTLIDKIESRQAPRGVVNARGMCPPPPDPDNPQVYAVTLDFEEEPVRRPDFVSYIGAELVRDDLPEDIRAAIEDIERLRNFLLDNDKRIGRDWSCFRD